MNIRKSAAAAAVVLAALAITAGQAVAAATGDSHDAGVSSSMYADNDGAGGSSRP
ncbi:hypothetical protein [Lentzea jiangxiensis]|uniref:Uncharacterized protein n=1 Tax=Lentzea jiangxiensis TaxID=641025 RepID=A0A1H0KPP9_9PSEU|nr:hypothetical protein [Lentzea jiangxiensis]SDO57947.1 hypothetical protein SAMN05421507_10323 [Lentzea jiangxiensis]